MKKHSLFNLCVLIFLFLTPVIQAFNGNQRNIRFTHITNNDGLPDNTTYSICQDHKGFIWIGSRSGLSKYDGRNISVYNIEIGSDKRQPGGLIRRVMEDRENRLWVLSQKGVNLYDRNKDKFTPVGIDTLTNFRHIIYQDEQSNIYLGGRNLLIFNEKENIFQPFYLNNKEEIRGFITSIVSDSKGQLWIGKMFDGLICVNNSKTQKTHHRHIPGDPYSLLSNKIVTLYTDQDERIWIGTEDKGICYYDITLQKFFPVEGFPHVCVRSFEKDPDGNFWIGTEDGVYIYSPTTGALTNYKQNYNDKHSLNDNAVYSIFKDRENNMLVGTYFGGINIFLNSFRQFFYYDYGYSQEYLSGKVVREIIDDPKGNLWIATEDGGLNYYDRSTEQFQHFKPDKSQNSLSYHNVHTVLLDSKNNLWVGTYLGGLNKYDPATQKFTHYRVRNYPGLPIDNIFALMEDSDGDIWIGTTNGVSTYNPEKNQFERFLPQGINSQGVDNFCEDSDGDIWISTRTHGAFCYNKKTKEIQNFRFHPDENSISDNFIHYIFEDSQKYIWFGTSEGGLCRYDKHSNLFTVFTRQDGLPSNTIFSIIECDAGNLWISTNNGLSCLNIDDYSFTNFSVSEGLPNKQFNYNSAYKAPDGMLYFGTINGMIAFYPDELQTIQNDPQVEFTDFRIFGKSIDPVEEDSPLLRNIEEIQEIRLNYDQAKSFTFEFTVPSLSHATSTFYAIKLASDKNWSFIGSQNHVTYANLSPGEYLFHVKAAFNNKWNDKASIKSIKIIIDPPFWLSNTAYLLYFVLFIILFTLFLLFMKNRQREKRMILTERLEKEKIKEINTLKLNFFTNISHELRTPLSLILVPLQSFLDRNVFSPEVSPRMKQIVDNARRMNNLIEELMLFTKIETKQEKIRVKKGNLLDFVRDISEGFEVLAEEKELEYEINITGSDKEVWFAPVKVEKIIYNLLSNAFKYTDHGKVTIHASYEQTDDFTYLNLIVSDTGIGISENQKDKIFENYYQVNHFIKSKKTGFGIGLALVRELVLLHRGSIDIQSEPGKGSDFIVRLNVSPQAFNPDEVSDKDANEQFMEDYKFMPVWEESTIINPQNTTMQESGNKDYKLLIIEDNKELLQAFKELFIENYHVITATDGKEGYESAQKHLPDIIISDVMMPEMNGYELARKLKSEIETSHIPLILLTARTGDEAQLEGYQSGADLYIEKPFHPTLVYKQISNLLQTKESQKRKYLTNEIKIGEIDANAKDKKLISEIEQVILRNLDNSDFSLNDVLKEIGIGRTLLHVKLKSIVGLSATEFINKVRLNESIKFLIEGKNVSETAYACGFSSANYYSRCFKKSYGMSPNEYLKKVLFISPVPHVKQYE